MIEDRTIVVESVATGGSAPLDEGSLLVIRVQEEKSQLIPLGKVFEVFGPVSRPLYTIRLVSPKDKAVRKPEQKEEANESVERDADEISLNDDEHEEQDETKEVETEDNVTTEGERAVSDSNKGQADPWAPNGKYSKLLEESTERMPVYYIPDITQLLDTGAVIRNSGRGSGESLEITWTMYVCLILRRETYSC